MSSRRLADPLRLSAEGASPDSVTSDVPCRRSGARAERSTLSFAAVASAFADALALPLRPRITSSRAGLEQRSHDPGRLRSVRGSTFAD